MPTDSHRRRVLSSLTATGLAAAGLPGARAQTWPSKPIRIFVGFAPGGTTDPYARVYGEVLSQKFGVPVVVENRPGAGGNISLGALAREAADGHTIGITTSTSVWGGRTLYRKLPFDPDRDFTPLGWFPVGPLLMAVPAAMPVNNVREWVELARRNPVTMASYGPGSVPHLAIEEFNKRYGTQVNVAHYKGEGPMWSDVSTGVTQAGIGSYVALTPYLQRGGVKVIASIGSERSPKLPQVTSFASQGFDGELFRLAGGLLMLAPAATPEPILQRISQAFVEGADSAKAVALREAFAIEDKPTTIAEARRKWRDESPIWIRLTEQLGVKID
ncbi:MAG: tripartite tricarboxylate transporter substrate binding protein [Burkholderiales bacterium]|nr:tripartite tricarboxylate transporter substrate binding protein [Burkholderiales bacterium]